MKLTKSQLKEMIREELLKEQSGGFIESMNPRYLNEIKKNFQKCGKSG